MKVLMLGWELPPHNSGGLGVACYQLCKSLSKKGIAIEFALPYRPGASYEFMKVHSMVPADVVSIDQRGAAYGSYQYTFVDGRVEWHNLGGQQSFYEDAVVRLSEKLEFDVIHAHDWLTFRAALRVKAASGKPLVAHIHSLESDRAAGNIGNQLVREIEYMTLMVADRVVAVSQHTRNEIIRNYQIPTNKIEVIHNSLDLDMFVPLDDHNIYHYLEQMKHNGYKVVSSIGRLTIQKGLTNLLRAMPAVIYREPKTLLLIVGSGEQQFELMELAADLGILPNVLFTGFQRGQKWRDAFSIGDVFVMPSVSEPFGLTPLEAIGYGTPALISRQSGVSEVLKSALKVDFWDIDEMANQITAVLQNPTLSEELLSQSKLEYERLSWEPASEKLLGIYNTPNTEFAL